MHPAPYVVRPAGVGLEHETIQPPAALESVVRDRAQKASAMALSFQPADSRSWRIVAWSNPLSLAWSMNCSSSFMVRGPRGKTPNPAIAAEKQVAQVPR